MNAQLIARDELTAADRAAMYALLGAHFDGVERDQFDADLAEKNWAVLLRDEQGLVGFSTICFYTALANGGRCSVVYSGDTIVDPRGWNGFALPRAWIHAVIQLHREHGHGRLWWLLITSGYRTYRFLPVFWREFHPRCDAAAPAGMASLRAQLARDRFGSRFDATTGVVRLDRPQVLRPHLHGVQPGRMADPHVAYFVAANPGHAHGDELVCLTELCASNLTPAGRRMVGGAWSSGRPIAQFTAAAGGP